MDITKLELISGAIGAIGVLLTIFSIFYAIKQNKKMADTKKDEMISLWAHLDRIRTLLMQIQRITDDDGFIKNGQLTSYQLQQIPQIFKGLCDQYIRIAEMISKKTPNLSIEVIDNWEKLGKFKTKWQKEQFIIMLIGNQSHNKWQTLIHFFCMSINAFN